MDLIWQYGWILILAAFLAVVIIGAIGGVNVSRPLGRGHDWPRKPAG